MLKRLSLDKAQHIELKEYAEEKGIMFMSSPFDKDSADMLAEIGVGGFKIGSGEVTNWPLLRHVAKKGLPMIISSGMSNLHEVVAAADQVRRAGNDKFIFLHCVSQVSR